MRSLTLALLPAALLATLATDVGAQTPPPQRGEPLRNEANRTIGNTEVQQMNRLATTAGIDASRLKGLSLEQAMMQVQSERSHLLEQQLKTQLDTVKSRNEEISRMNQALVAARSLHSQFKPGDAASAPLPPTLPPAALKTWQDAAQAAGLTGLDIATKGKLDVVIEKIKGRIDSLNSTSQMDMLRLQSLSNKRNAAFEQMTNFMKKMQDSRSSVIRNMR